MSLEPNLVSVKPMQCIFGLTAGQATLGLPRRIDDRFTDVNIDR